MLFLAVVMTLTLEVPDEKACVEIGAAIGAYLGAHTELTCVLDAPPEATDKAPAPLDEDAPLPEVMAYINANRAKEVHL
jgi:hypothetical protein